MALYIIIGIVSEVLFTALCDLCNPQFLASWNVHQASPRASRNPRAVGYTFLWMLPIYACLILIEPVSQSIAPLFWFWRGLIYMSILFGVEFVTGGLIQFFTGKCPWDYRASKFSVCGWIRLDFAPVWFGFGMFIEWLSPKLIALTPAISALF